MYQITYNGIDGQAGLYATIRRLLDGKWFRVAGGWTEDSALASNVALTESPTEPGLYSAEAELTPADGMLYVISIYTAGGVLLFESEHLSASQQQTVLEMINTVQSRLRLPKSAAITDAHASLLLGFANEVQLDYMAEQAEWDELKMKCAFSAIAGQSLYSIFPAQGAAVDMLEELKIGNDEIVKATDAEFGSAVAVSGSIPSKPSIYRIYGRAGKALFIELYPTPDATYRVDINLYQRPIRMTAATDVPLLDQDTIVLGMMYLAKKEQGEEYNAEEAVFIGKMYAKGRPHGGGNPDVEFL